MDIEALFNILNSNNDSPLSRTQLYTCAQSLRWHWEQAPLYAVLDLLTVKKDLSKQEFIAAISEIISDPWGPFGKVLLRSHSFWQDYLPQKKLIQEYNTDISQKVILLLKEIIDDKVAKEYKDLLAKLPDSAKLNGNSTAMLVIDPQHSFTHGSWMHSIGPEGRIQTKPIALAFDNCIKWLKLCYPHIETMFSRCPFPPQSYAWHQEIAKVIPQNQAYFIKPGNSVLWPPTNGFSQWVENLLERGKKTLVIGGCTLNSCVRISAIETQKNFKDLQVVVDLSLSGARSRNFIKAALFGGLSSVEAAVQEMQKNGVVVVAFTNW